MKAASPARSIRWAGASYVEHLTDTIEAEAEALIKPIDAMGGMVAAIENGFARRLIDRGRLRMVPIRSNEKSGSSSESTITPTTSRLDAPLRGRRGDPAARNRPDSTRSRPDATRRREELARGPAARPPRTTTRNLMPPILDAVGAYSTIGEICGVLREVFGEYQESDDEVTPLEATRRTFLRAERELLMPLVLRQVEHGAGIITLNHDSKRNALCRALHRRTDLRPRRDQRRRGPIGHPAGEVRRGGLVGRPRRRRTARARPRPLGLRRPAPPRRPGHRVDLPCRSSP